VSAFAILRDLVQSTITYADEDAYTLLDLDQADDELLEELVGEAWNAPSPGFYPELSVERPQFMTWLALRATAKALHAPDTEWGDADLDDHLAAVEVAERWCASSYARLTGEDIEEVIRDRRAIVISDMERWPKPTYTIWRVAHTLSEVTASPYEIDPQEVRSLLVEALIEIRNHADELKLLASHAHYPAGDPRRPAPEIPEVTPPPTPDGVKHFDPSLTVDLDNYTDDGTVRVHSRGGERDVPYSNLRHLMDVAHQVCELPAGVSYACAIRYDVAGRPARITFVRCQDKWQEIAASELQVGDRLYEDIDYPYVVSQVITSYEDDQVVVERSGRGWLALKLATPVRAQRG